LTEEQKIKKVTAHQTIHGDSKVYNTDTCALTPIQFQERAVMKHALLIGNGMENL